MTAHDLSVEDIAVIVAFKNEAAFLKVCAESLLEASRGRAELIFVNDASTDDSLEVLKPYKDKIRLVESDGSGPGKARNLAWKSSSKKYIAFLDADCRVPSDWLDAFVSAFHGKAKTFASIGGRQEVYFSAAPKEKFIANLLSDLGFVSDYLHTQKETVEVLHNPTCNVLYDKEALVLAQGFDENFWPCEDLDLDLRLKKLGMNALYSPTIYVEHKRPNTNKDLFKMMNRYGFGHAKLVKKHGLCQKLHVLPLLTALVVLGSLFLLGHSVDDVYGFWLILLMLLTFILFVKIRSVLITLKYLPYVVVMLIAWNLGFFSGWMMKKKIATHRS